MIRLNLGQFIKALKKCGVNHQDDDSKTKSVSFDFGNATPSDCESYRGYYEDIALGYHIDNYKTEPCKIDKLIAILESSVGKTFTGYKGGDFEMSEQSDMWVANTGDATRTVITGVEEFEWYVIINTAYCDD